MAERTTNEFITLLRTNSTAVAAEEAIKAADSATEALAYKTAAELKVWMAEAETLTAESNASEAEDVVVKEYTSNDDGTFTVTDTVRYSALHWQAKAMGSVGMANIIEDISPQLGGNLDVNGFSITGYATLAGATYIGQVKGITPISAEDLTRKDYVDSKAPLASPALIGIPTAPTAVIGTNTSQVATTAFVIENSSATESIGENQIWQDLTASRATATNYTNSSGRAIAIKIRMGGASTSRKLTVDGIIIDETNGSNIGATLSAIIPPNGIYSVDAGSISYWIELRA